MYVVGLEVSSSSTKAILYSEKGELIAERTKALTSKEAKVTWQNPESIWLASIKCLRALLTEANKPILAIGLGGIWHSLLLLDKKRQPLENIRTWADLSWNTGQEPDETLANLVYQKTGCLEHGMYPFWKLKEMYRTQFPLFEQTKYLSSQIEYLFEQFTGEVAVSACTASGTGLMNIHSRTWDEELVNRVGLDLTMLPSIVESDYTAQIRPELAKELDLSPTTLVTIGSADGALNQIASGGLQTGIMTFSVGTSGALRIASRKPLLGEGKNTWCYYVVDGQYLVGIATHATSNLEWVMDTFNLKVHGHDYLANKATDLHIDAGPFFLPFLYGERGPGWQAGRQAGFVGLEGSHNRVHLYKATLEGILFALYHSYLELSKLSVEPQDIRLSGGIIHSPYWRQMAADIFGRKISITGIVHESTLGAALLGLKALGVKESVTDFMPPLLGEIKPNMQAHAQYQKRFKLYLEHYNKY